MERLFGTDGVRGVANVVLTPELMLDLGRALGASLSDAGRERPCVVVGRDPRPSSGLLEAAFVAGLCSTGTDAVTVGVIPTAGVAFLAPRFRAHAGAVVTASHNPLEDNGLKLFDENGYKYSDEAEIFLENLARERPPSRQIRGRSVGRIIDRSTEGKERYVKHLLSGIPPLGGIPITVDCANGAAADIAPQVYRAAGAEVIEVASDTSGDRINCGVGATNPAYLQKALRNGISRIGLAHDGDADRLIAVDESGRIVDGADAMAIFAVDAHKQGRLPGQAIVTTHMTNSGLRTSLKRYEIDVIESPIGDRAVLREMVHGGYVVGGEQSGHVIMLDRATTGDGILSGLRLLAAMSQSEKSLRELTKVWERSPQTLINVPVQDRKVLEQSAHLTQVINKERQAITSRGGRLTVRMSTIEDVVRVVCEAGSQAESDEVASRIAECVKDSVSFE